MIRASFRCLVTSVTLLVSASSVSFAEDNKWAVDYVTEKNIHASVNGQVTHGDKLMVRFVKGCLSPVKLCHNLIDTEDQNYGPQTSLRRGHIEAVA